LFSWRNIKEGRMFFFCDLRKAFHLSLSKHKMMMFFNGRRLKVACFDDRVLSDERKRSDGSCTTKQTRMRIRRRTKKKHAAAVNVDLADGP